MKGLEETLRPIVEKAVKAAEATGEFVIEQAPLVLQEFYWWHTSHAILMIIIAIGIYLIGRYLPTLWLSEKYDEEKHKGEGFRYFGRYSKGSMWDGDLEARGEMWLAWSIFALCGVASVIVFITHAVTLAKILIAPRLYLIEYFLN